uniref:Thyroglobulin type-1 domain-containing protein n=1 Tax=Anguilla anguilla TaxID=7936 RepID=A0A0E9TH92_ANGAN
MKWATCDGTPCECFLMVGNGERQVLNCTTLIPQVFPDEGRDVPCQEGPVHPLDWWEANGDRLCGQRWDL